MHIRNRWYRRAAVGSVTTAIGLLAVLLPVGHASATTPVIKVSTTAGVSGATDFVSGSGWKGYDTVLVDLVRATSATFMCEVSASSSGTITSQSCTVPTSLTQGSYTLSATDETLTATTPFTLNPGITALGFDGETAFTVAAGQTVGLSGSGFAASSALKATFNGTAVTLTPPVTSSTTGGFSGTDIVVPAATAAGSYPVGVKDAAGHTATIHLTVFAATDTVSPTAGVAGATVTVNGTGWPSNDAVRVELNQGSTQNTVCFSTTDGNGLLSQSCTVPTTLPEGGYSLVVEDNSLAVTTPFTLDPGISILGFDGEAATVAATGQTIGLSGSGFAANSTLKAMFNGVAATLTTPETSSTTGAFSGTGIVVPPTTAAGTYPVSVKDAGGHTATAHVQVFAATLTPTPTVGIAGATLTVRGTAWPSNDTVRVELNQGSTQNTVCFSTIDGNGTLAQSCALPTFLPQGKYSLVVEDNSLAKTTSFTLDPGITALGFDGEAAVDAAPGQTVGLSGSGFAPNLALGATFNGTAVALTPSTTSSGSGAFSGTAIVIPASTATGFYPVSVKDSAGHIATVKLNVYAAKVTVAPATGISGQPFSVSGTGWPSDDTVRVELNQGSTQNTVCFSTTDGNGTLAQSCTVPTFLPQGKYSLVVEDNSLAVTAPFTLDPGISLFGSSGQPLASAAPGAAATLTGSGFAPNSTIVKMTIGTHTVGFSSTPVSGPSGSFEGAAFTVPSLAAGTYTVTVTDGSGHSGTAQLVIS